MMNHFLILLSALVLAQCLTAEESDPFGKDVEELLGPLLKEFAELKKLVDEVKQYQKTQKIPSLAFAETLVSLDDTPFIETWDSDACNKLTETLGKAADLAENITDWVFNAGFALGRKIFHLIHCGMERPDEAYQCVADDISDIKDAIDSYKPIVQQFKADIHLLALEIREEFRKCLRIQRNA